MNKFIIDEFGGITIVVDSTIDPVDPIELGDCDVESIKQIYEEDENGILVPKVIIEFIGLLHN